MASPVPTDMPTISQEQMSRLPLEIRLMILDNVFEAVFVPGEIVPHQQINHINEDCFVDSNEDFWYKYVLRSLDNNLYEKYKNLYWSNNTWASPVPRAGPGFESTGIFIRLPTEFSSRIHSVRLVLCAKDGHYRITTNYEHDADLFPDLDLCQVSSARSEKALNYTWFRKIREVFGLQLENLILDVSDAFPPTGNFLDLSMPSLFKFRYGVPRRLEIIAPDEQLTDEVRRRIRIANDRKA